MASIRKKVIHALRVALLDVTDALEQTPSGRVTGVVISPRFVRKSYPQRQRLISSALKKSLTPKEMQDLGPIVGLTPSEAFVEID